MIGKKVTKITKKKTPHALLRFPSTKTYPVTTELSKITFNSMN